MAARPLTVVRKALLEKFHWCWRTKAEAKAEIAKATFKGSDDPGQWSPSAPVVIHCESGIPSPLYDAMTLWEGVQQELDQHGLYFEPVNGAVVTVWGW